MENKNIIIILLIVVVILAAAVAVMFLSPFDVKTDTKLAITSNATLYEGENLTVKLTDINGTEISGETVNVTITDENGGSYKYSIITNVSGIGVLELDKTSGNYTVNCTYGGNENYTGNSTSQKLEILEEVVETQQTSSEPQGSSSSSSGGGLHYDEEINVYYNDNGVIVDPDGEHPQGVGSSYSHARELRDKWERGEPVMV